MHGKITSDCATALDTLIDQNVQAIDETAKTGTPPTTTTMTITTTTATTTTTTTTVTLGPGTFGCNGALFIPGDSDVSIVFSCPQGGTFSGFGVYFPGHQISNTNPPTGFNCQATTWSPGGMTDYFWCTGPFASGNDVTGGTVELSPSPVMGMSLGASFYVSMSGSSGLYGPYSVTGP
jgi:hypothetical protein